MIFGFDISHYQGKVSFAQMQYYGAKFVVPKAGQGNWVDQMFTENWTKAKGVLPRASYWYYDNRYPPKDQARKYYDILRLDLEPRCWLDLEDRSVGVYAGWHNWFDFLEEFRTLYPGAQVGIYTNFFYAVEMLSNAKAAQRDYFKQYPLWLASYGSDPFHPSGRELIPLPWLEYLILQSGTPAIGIEAGVESKEIDMDWMSEANYRQYFGGTVEPPTETGDKVMQGTVNPGITSLNVRDATGATTGKYLRAGDKVYGAVTDGRIYFLRIYRAGGAVEEQPGNAATAYMTLADAAEPVTGETFPPRIGLVIGSETKWYVAE